MIDVLTKMYIVQIVLVSIVWIISICFDCQPFKDKHQFTAWWVPLYMPIRVVIYLWKECIKRTTLKDV